MEKCLRMSHTSKQKFGLDLWHSAGKSQACVWDEVRVENPVQIRLIVLIRPIRLDFAEYTFTLAQNGVAQAPRALLSIVECVC